MPAKLLLALAVAAGSAIAWQAGGRLGLDDKALAGLANASLRFNRSSPPYLTREARTAYLGMDAAARTALVQELAPAVKAIVMAPEFQKTIDDSAARNSQAINRGVAAPGWLQQLPNAKVAPAGNDSMLEAAGSFGQMLASMPPAMPKKMLDDDLKNWEAQLSSAGAETAGKLTLLVSRARLLVPLAQSNPKLFQKGYAQLKALDMLSLDKEHLLTGLSVEQTQQQRYNELGFKGLLKSRLAEFIALVKSVDFAAATNGPRRTFVKPEYEKKSPAWKLAYRIGAAPSQAAAQVAEQWLKEL